MTSAGRPGRGPVWSWTEPEPTQPRAPLSRAAIVAAAIRRADAEGLDAVTIRGVAALLRARPMSLYKHIGSKEDLLDLMFDELVGLVLEGGALPEHWRAAIEVVAARKRRLALAHPWLVVLYGRRPLVGPSTLAQLEQSVVALRGLTTDLATAVRVVNAVDDYTMGHVTRELTFGAARSEQWQNAVRPYLRQVAASGHYPVLGPLLTDPVPDDAEDTFTSGLAWLLDGIEARLG
jgi:AcrR family transcriptional regulator